MSNRIPDLLLTDMLDSIQSIFEFIQEMNFDQFANDRKTKDAVVRNLLLLGEAANRFPKEFRDSHTEVEWSRIIRTRHILTHEYERVDYEVIWRIITLYLPPLYSVLDKLKGENREP